MSVFGVPCLDQGEIDAARRRHPRFRGEVPPEAQFWSREDLEEFLQSQGEKRPNEAVSTSIQSCPLLSKLRLTLAENHVRKAAAEYLSYCRHRLQRANLCSLPEAMSCTPVRRAREAPARLKEPVTIVPKRDQVLRAEAWTLDFLKASFGNVLWQCQSRPPAFQDDPEDASMVEACIWDYADYMDVISNMDPECLEDNSLAYPRVHIDGWCPFVSFARKAFEEAWKELNPPGVKDLTPRWCELYAGIVNEGDWLQYLAQFYRIDIGAIGSYTRLHTENHGAHVWFTQIEGQRLFFLFPPEDAAKLYERRGGYIDPVEGFFMQHATTVSPVDPFYPSLKKHPRFGEAHAHVALLGEGKTLVVPAGWWWCSVVLEPSVTLRHNFWGMENRVRIWEEWWAPFEQQTPAEREELRPLFSELREELMQDDGTTTDKYVVVDDHH